MGAPDELPEAQDLPVGGSPKAGEFPLNIFRELPPTGNSCTESGAGGRVLRPHFRAGGPVPLVTGFPGRTDGFFLL